MERDFGRSIGFALALSTPGGIAIAALFALGFLDGKAALVAVAAMLSLSAVMAIASVLSLAGTRAAIDRLGPNAASDEAAAPDYRSHRLSLAARAIWPTVLRLRRAWREHAAQAEAQLASAEAVIAAVPDPLIMIDRQRRIVRSNAAAAEFIGPGTQPRDLAAALRNPVLLAAADDLDRLHRDAARAGARGCRRPRALSRDHARAGAAHGAARRRFIVAVAHRAQRACRADRPGGAGTGDRRSRSRARIARGRARHPHHPRAATRSPGSAGRP